MKKNQLTPAHYALFVISILAVLMTTTSYVRSALKERAIQNQEAGRAGGRGGNQGGPGGFNPQQMAERRLEQMTQQLQLTAEQRAKIQTIQQSFAPRTQAIFQDASLSREQRREKMQPLRTEMDAQIKQVLTPEQQTKYDQMQAQRRARFGGGNRSGNEGASATVSPILPVNPPVNPPPPPTAPS